MKITLAEWRAFEEDVRKASQALESLETRLISLLCGDEGPNGLRKRFGVKSPESQLILKCLGRVDDAQGSLAAYMWNVQSEWTGGDSSDPRHFTLREPNWVSIGHAFPREQVEADPAWRKSVGLDETPTTG